MSHITDQEAKALWLGTLGDDGRYSGGLSFKKVKEQMKPGDRTARFQKLLGGKEKMKEFRDLGAGGGIFGGKGGPRIPAAPPDDSKVPHITTTPTKDGWRSRMLYPSRNDVIISPKGKEYVFAKSSERADLIYDGKYGTTRLRLLEDSAVARKNKRASRRDEKAILHVAKRRKAKKERRARKAAITKRLTINKENSDAA